MDILSITTKARNIARYFGKTLEKNVDDSAHEQIDLRYVYENNLLKIIGYNVIKSADPNPPYYDYNILIEYDGKIVFNDLAQLKKDPHYLGGNWEDDLEKIYQEFLDDLTKQLLV